MHTRSLCYGDGPVYDFDRDAMLDLLGALRAFFGGHSAIHFETHRYFDDATQTDYRCKLRGGTFVTTSTMTNCGFTLELVVHSEDDAAIDAIAAWLDREMAVRLPRKPAPAPAAPPPREIAPFAVAEPPNAVLSPGEQAIVDLVVRGMHHHDADNDGGFREFFFRVRDRRFVQIYGSYADATRGEMIYAGPKSFVRDLLATCHFERAHTATTEEFLEAVRASMARVLR